MSLLVIFSHTSPYNGLLVQKALLCLSYNFIHLSEVYLLPSTEQVYPLFYITFLSDTNTH